MDISGTLFPLHIVDSKTNISVGNILKLMEKCFSYIMLEDTLLLGKLQDFVCAKIPNQQRLCVLF